MSISRNAGYNAAAALLPSVLTLVTVPLYLKVVGLERYGMLTLLWVILGYSGFLDVALGLAVARRIAAARDNAEEASSVFWTSLGISVVTGIIGATLVYVSATLYFRGLTTVPTAFRAEVAHTIPLLSSIVPITLLLGVFAGALQGRERFLEMNGATVGAHTMLAVLPLLFAYIWSPTLTVLVAGSLTARLVPAPWLYWVAKRAVPLGRPKAPSMPMARELLGFGGWVSLTVIANALINTVDRLFIGSRIGPAAVPGYAIPYGLVSRVILIPHSLSTALFPRYAYAEAAEQERLRTTSIQAVTVIVTPALIGLVALARPFFTVWVGHALALTAAPVAYVLAGGFWLYCVGHMAYSMLQAKGRPDLVSKVLLAELLPYCAALYIGMKLFGVLGAAGAFTLRTAVDCVIFVTYAEVPGPALKRLMAPAALTLAAIIVAASVESPIRYLLLAPLWLASVAWSVRNMPDVVRAQLRRIAALSPWGRRVVDEPL